MKTLFDSPIIRIGLGFLFRFLVIFWLFRLGIAGFLSEDPRPHSSLWTDNIFLSNSTIFIIPIFVSFYLLFNLFSKKVTEETYEKWSIAAIIFLVIIISAYIFAVVNAGHILPFSFETLGSGYIGMITKWGGYY